jgi:hypothetical protein
MSIAVDPTNTAELRRSDMCPCLLGQFETPVNAKVRIMPLLQELFGGPLTGSLGGNRRLGRHRPCIHFG